MVGEISHRSWERVSSLSSSGGSIGSSEEESGPVWRLSSWADMRPRSTRSRRSRARPGGRRLMSDLTLPTLHASLSPPWEEQRAFASSSRNAFATSRLTDRERQPIPTQAMVATIAQPSAPFIPAGHSHHGAPPLRGRQWTFTDRLRRRGSVNAVAVARGVTGFRHRPRAI